ncbi:bifunctional DedA family/phosphatase PAP2 family protein [Patescibacteria group bacterium]|nr:bifunctional DedA family/phosphatase PAP2 family protein [Patescibacteria group bacterium]
MDYLNHFLPAMEHFGMFGYWLVLLISLLESLAFVGVIIPGSVLVIAAGFLSAHGYFDIGDLIWFAAAGAILGDGLSYYLGTKGTKFFHNENKILKLSHLERGRRFFKKHGNKSVFLGRFVGPIRSIVPFIAGLSKMDKLSFLFWNIASAFLWAAAHLFLGYFFGGAVKSVEAWSTRAGVFILFVFLSTALIWLAVKKSGRFFVFVKSVFTSVKEAIAANPDVRRFAEDHPVFFGFIGRRISARRFSGLPFTLLSISFVYIFSLFFGVVKDVIASGPIVASDVRVGSLLYSFRDLELVKFFTWITVLAKWEMIISFAATASIILWLWKERTYVIPLFVTIAGGGLFGLIGKLALHRERPETALYVENTFSFPSGHSTIAAAFFGFIIYILLRRKQKLKYKINTFFFGLTLILLIGLSRLYLGVHFLSDVWGGYLLGLLWLFIGIAISEWLISRNKSAPLSPSRKIKIISAAIIFVQAAFYAGFAFNYNPPINKKAEKFNQTVVLSAPELLNGNRLPRFTETLTGENQEPISFIIIAKDDGNLIESMQKAGWRLADRIDISSFARFEKSAFLKEDYPTAPMTPSFWNSKINDMGFEKPTDAKNARERHHARFWRTQFETPDGGRAYVGTASLDVGMKWLITHKIKSDIDTEREFLFADLEKGGFALNYEKIQSVAPVLGENFLGDQFFTDGKLYLIVLK